MSAERGWIGEPQLIREWHMPGWVKTGGRHFGQPPVRRARRRPEQRVAEREAADGHHDP